MMYVSIRRLVDYEKKNSQAEGQKNVTNQIHRHEV